jgi:Flp pilus assembly protein TadD
LFAVSQLTDAVRSAEYALSLDGIRSEEAATLMEQVTRLAFEGGRFEQAGQWSRQLIRLRANADDWFLLGVIEERCGRPSTAQAAIDRAAALDPASLEILEAQVRLAGSSASSGALAKKLEQRKRWESQRANQR